MVFLPSVFVGYPYIWETKGTPSQHFCPSNRQELLLHNVTDIRI